MRRSLVVQAAGFPVVMTKAGVLGGERAGGGGKGGADVGGELHTASFTFHTPAFMLPLSAVAEVALYPTAASTLTSALTSLIREPCGCFEQVSDSRTQDGG